VSDIFDPYHRWLGISPKHRPPNHYRLLGLEQGESDPEVIRDAAERQMGHVRQYQLGPHAELSQQILNELAAAKRCLLDAEKKAAYDASLAMEERPALVVALPLVEASSQPPLPPVRALAPMPVRGIKPSLVRRPSALLLWGSISVAAAGITTVAILVGFSLRPPAKVAGVTNVESAASNPKPATATEPAPPLEPKIVAPPPPPPEAPPEPVEPLPAGEQPVAEADWPSIGAQISRAVVRVQVVAGGGEMREGQGLVVGADPLLLTSAALAEQVETGTVFFADGVVQPLQLPATVDARRGLAAFRMPPTTIEVTTCLNLPRAGTPLATFHVTSPTSVAPKLWNVIGTAARDEMTRRLGWPAEHSAATQSGLDAGVWLDLAGPAASADLGAPLFNAQAQLAGLLVWSAPERQAHFAVPAAQLADFHRQTLAAMSSAATVASQPEGPLFPSGSPFSTRFFDTANDPLQLAFSAAQSTGQVIDVGAVGDFLKGFVRPGPLGAAATFFDREAKRPALAIEYRNEQRHGVLQTWNASGQRTYCCQYANGQRDGLCCLLEDGQPRLALEYRNQRCQGVLLLAGATAAQSFPDLNSAQADAAVGPKLAQLRQIEEAVDRTENLIIREFKAEIKKREEQERRRLASEESRRARERINERIRQHQEESNKNLRALQRRVSGH